MYPERYDNLARKRAQLITDCARQRAALGDEFAAWQGSLRAVDRGVAATRFFHTHPLAVAAVLGIVAVLGRRHLLSWASRGLLVWRSWQTIRTLVRALAEG